MKTPITTIAIAGACLALAAPASAGYHGSDLTPTYHASSLSCSAYPCTMAQHHFDGYESAELPQDGVITQWRVKLGAGSKATLQIIRGDDGYRALDRGPTVTGKGGVTTASTRIPLGDDHAYAAVEMASGSLLTDHVDRVNGPSAMVFHGSLDPFEYAGVDENPGDELLSQVRVEPDTDYDGLGDETQDNCVGDCHHTPGGQIGEPSNDPQTGYGSGSTTGSSSSYQDELAGRPSLKFAVLGKAWLDTSGKVPELRAYFANEGRYPVTGTVKLLYGKKRLAEGLGNDKIQVPTDDHGGDFFKVPKALAKKLRRGKKVKLTLVAKLTAKDGTKRTVKKRITAIGRGPTLAYDGVYSGSNGLKFTVSKGFLTDVVGDVRTFCPSSNKFRVQPLSEPDGFPAMVGRGGSFRADGDYIKDHVKLQGRLSRRGKGRGKLSLFHTELVFGDGVGIDQCAGANGWTAKRVAGR